MVRHCCLFVLLVLLNGCTVRRPVDAQAFTARLIPARSSRTLVLGPTRPDLSWPHDFLLSPDDMLPVLFFIEIANISSLPQQILVPFVDWRDHSSVVLAIHRSGITQRVPRTRAMVGRRPVRTPERDPAAYELLPPGGAVLVPVVSSRHIWDGLDDAIWPPMLVGADIQAVCTLFDGDGRTWTITSPRVQLSWLLEDWPQFQAKPESEMRGWY